LDFFTSYYIARLDRLFDSLEAGGNLLVANVYVLSNQWNNPGYQIACARDVPFQIGHLLSFTTSAQAAVAAVLSRHLALIVIKV
jgi:hypothetical protein